MSARQPLSADITTSRPSRSERTRECPDEHWLVATHEPSSLSAGLLKCCWALAYTFRTNDHRYQCKFYWITYLHTLKLFVNRNDLRTINDYFVVTIAQYLAISPRSFQFLNVNDLSESARVFVSDAIDVFLRNIQATCGHDCRPIERKVVVHLKVESSSLQLDWETNEGYDLEISSSGN